jgi:hypothetical protein
MDIAYAVTSTLRLGASIGGSYDSISAASQLAGESTTSAMYQGSTSSMSIEANTQQIVSALGVQYRPLGWLGLGMVLRPPSARIFGGSTIIYDAISNTSVEQQLHFRSGGTFEWRQPLQISFGATSHIGPVNVEMDLFWHAPSGTYTLFSSTDSMRVVTAQGGGTSPVVTSTPFPSVQTSTRSILNGSFGGNMRLGEVWWLHAGAFISQAPTYANDPFFQAFDFYGFRAGASLRQKKGFTGSIGLGYEIGKSARAVGLGSFPGTVPTPGNGGLTVQTLSLLLAVGYNF